MKYYEVDFTLSPLNSDACDLLAAIAGEAGFETFEETDDGLTGYVQQQLFNQELLDTLLADFPLSATTVTYTVGEAEDRDWNEQWEQEGFEPHSRGDKAYRPRRTPPACLSTSSSTINIEIDAQLAFRHWHPRDHPHGVRRTT